MSDLENLPDEIAQTVDAAIQNDRTEASSDIERERLKLESQRIKAEERINERMAERDEHVAEIQNNAELYRGMLEQALAKFDEFFSRTAPQHIEVNTGDTPNVPDNEMVAANEDTEIPNEATAEQLPEEIENVGEEVDTTANQALDNSTEIVNGGDTGNSRRGRKKRGRR